MAVSRRPVPRRAGHREAKGSRKNATAEDVANAAGNLRSKDANEADKGMKDLDQILQEAKDPEVRKAARKAVQDAIAKCQQEQGAEGKNRQAGAEGEKPGKPSPSKGDAEKRRDAGEPAGAHAHAQEGAASRRWKRGTVNRAVPRKSRGHLPEDQRGRRLAWGSRPAAAARGDGDSQGQGRGVSKNPARVGKEPGNSDGAGPGGVEQHRPGTTAAAGWTERSDGRVPAGQARDGPHDESGDPSTPGLVQGPRRDTQVRQVQRGGVELPRQTRLEQWETTHRAKPKEAPVAPRYARPCSEHRRAGEVDPGPRAEPVDLTPRDAPQPPAAYRDAYRQFNKPTAWPAEAGDRK